MRRRASDRSSFALTLSCNTAFAKLGVTVGGDALHSYGQRLRLQQSEPDHPAAGLAERLPALTDRAQIALSAIGQFNDTETPLQEAMVAAAIANHGTMMRPYLVQQVKAPDQSVVADGPARRDTPARSRAAQAGYLTAMMKGVTQNPSGTAYPTAGPPATNIMIAGKTGTAQNGVEQLAASTTRCSPVSRLPTTRGSPSASSSRAAVSAPTPRRRSHSRSSRRTWGSIERPQLVRVTRAGRPPRHRAHGHRFQNGPHWLIPPGQPDSPTTQDGNVSARHDSAKAARRPLRTRRRRRAGRHGRGLPCP